MSIPLYTNAEHRQILRIIPDLVHSRRLLLDLVTRELRARYRNAIIGFLWAILQPVLMMLVLTLVFGYLLAGVMPDRGGQSHSYAVFLLCGLVPWQFLSAAITNGTQSLLINGALIKKVYFPREVIPIAAVLYCLVSVTIGFATLFVVKVALEGLGTIGHGWVYVPLLLGIELTLAIGAALLFSALNVRFNDIAYMLEVALAFGFYATPIIYKLPESMSALPVSEEVGRWLYRLYLLNPMAGLVTAFRQALLDNRFPDPAMLAWAAGVAVVVLVIGVYVFRRNSPTFADYL